MMISQKMADALNEQVNAELFSSYLYLAMAAYFEEENLSGFASWMQKQSAEEYGHAMKIYGYLTQVDAKVVLKAIDQPKLEWDGCVAVFEDTLEHEKKITKMINDLTDLAISEKDHATNIFLHWFVEEQVEEVATSQSILDKIKFVEGNKSAVYMLDKELGSRE